MGLTVIILTKDEEVHISRAIASVSGIADKVLVVDSESNDQTRELAQKSGAEVITHKFINQAEQFNWALEQLPSDTDWVLRLDADEVVSLELSQEVSSKLSSIGQEVAGAVVSRHIAFMGRRIRYGGLFPVRIVRLFRFGKGYSEDRWMDEHIIVDGGLTEFKGEILDDNLRSLSWWVDKHNAYASREVIEILNSEFDFLGRTHTALLGKNEASVKRWVKENVYSRLPSGVRALVYFLYRYVLRCGFLDGKEGAAFHVLQGFWYRYLVDIKLYEVKKYMRCNSVDARDAVLKILGIDVKKLSN